MWHLPTPWDPIRPERLMLSLLPIAFHSEFSRQTSWKPRSVLHSNMAQGYLSHKKHLNFSTDVPWFSARWLVTLRVRRTHWFHGWGWFKTLNVHMNGGEKKVCNYKRFWCDSQRHHGFDLYIYVYIYIWLNKACSKGHDAHKSQEPELFLEFRRTLSVISAERAEYLRGNQVILHMGVSKPTNCMLIGNMMMIDRCIVGYPIFRQTHTWPFVSREVHVLKASFDCRKSLNIIGSWDWGTFMFSACWCFLSIIPKW